MFEDNNFAGCIDKITEYKKRNNSSDLLPEVDYLLVASAFYQGKDNVNRELREYLDTYPHTSRRNNICFMIASVYFNENDYRMAEYWFNQTDINYLSLSEQDDYAYRMGIVHLQNNNDDEAFRLFSLLNRHSDKYRNASEYYLAYLNYKRGNYNEALTQFNKIKNNSEFQPEVSYYITQIYFVQE